MELQKYSIQTAATAKTKKWKRETLTWNEIVDRLRTPIITPERYCDFMRMDKETQGAIKDRGAFVGGEFSGSARTKASLLFRSILSLDVDFGKSDFADTFAAATDFGFVIHGTHKHSASSPRYRVVAPLSRTVDADEYEAVARKIAELTDITIYDKTTFQPERCMFYPTISSDVEYYFHETFGNPVDVDAYLAMYTDWRDVSQWANHPDEIKIEVGSRSKTKEQATLKNNIIGEFCRAYTISAVISKYLSDVYSETDQDDRFTYVGGSTSKGLIVVQNGEEAVSYHGSDPISGTGHSYNAYDLVRIHKFGHLDKGNDTKASRAAMDNLVKEDELVKAARNEATKERRAKLTGISNSSIDMLGDMTEMEQELATTLMGQEYTLNDVTRDKDGNCEPSGLNGKIIMLCDPLLAGLIARNKFTGLDEYTRKPYWNIENNIFGEEGRAELRLYMETVHRYYQPRKFEDALSSVINMNSFHPVVDYLRSLKWDGISRIDTLLIDYLGAEDNIYIREAIRIMLLAAVNRVTSPGCKFDNSLVLVGDQGCGKSTFLRRLGKNWFNDSLDKLDGKDAMESLTGSWIIELAELSAASKSTVEATKQFISKSEDRFRAAYRRDSVTRLRQCVFFGTTNVREFLKDKTGNRRFMPVEVRRINRTDEIFTDDFEYIVDQVWAEAYYLSKDRPSLLLSPEAEAIANRMREGHEEKSEYTEAIRDYIDLVLPPDWYELSEVDRALFAQRNVDFEGEGGFRRKWVTVLEVGTECLGLQIREITGRVQQEIRDVLLQQRDFTDKNLTSTFVTIGGRRKAIRGFWRKKDL